MGRKKKEVIEAELRAKERENALHGDAKRGIVAILLFALAILFLLAFIGQAGKFGAMLAEYLSLVVGWSRWLLIPLFVLIGGMLLKRHATSRSDIIRYVGLSFALLSVLGLSHLFLGETAKELKEVASKGEGGGYVGYFLSAFLSEAMGKTASAVVLVAFLVSGVIAAFNVSLLSWYERLTKREEREDSAENEGTTKADTPDAAMTLASVEGAPPVEGIKKEESSTTLIPVVAPENIKNFRFLGDEDEKNQESLTESEGVTNISFEEPVKESTRPIRHRPRIRWELPPLELLDATVSEGTGGDIERTKEVIVSTLKYFGIEVEPGEVQVGPTVTQYTFRPAIGVRLSQITTLQKDLALALAAEDIRIEAPIPGRSLIGIEVPNKSKATVHLRGMFQSKEFRGRPSNQNLTIILGKDVSGKHILADLGRMPHLLIAGTTRSGKSVFINTLILSLLYQNSPEDLKLILVDPKRVELSLYKGIPHLRTDVIVDNHKVINVLRWAVSEMDQRNKILESTGSRDLAEYKEKVEQGVRRKVIDPDTNEVREEELDPLPQIVIIIDEMADLMVAHGKEVQNFIVRIAQMGRAPGIHLVLATQRPEVNVVTGLIKANMPARISFKLKSQIDSRTILDVGGAEKLLGGGDMLYSSSEAAGLQRIQGVLVSGKEVQRVVRFLLDQKVKKGYDEIGDDLGRGNGTLDMGDDQSDAGEDDPIYEQAKKLVVETQRVSTTYLQTYLKIGYPKAARITELLEKNGVIGPSEGGRRTVLVKSLDEGKQYGDDPLMDQSERDRWQM